MGPGKHAAVSSKRGPNATGWLGTSGIAIITSLARMGGEALDHPEHLAQRANGGGGTNGKPSLVPGASTPSCTHMLYQQYLGRSGYE